VLLMQGSATRMSARGVVGQLLQALPQARQHLIDGAGHLGPVTHVQPVLQAMQKHLEKPGTALPAPQPPRMQEMRALAARNRLPQPAQPAAANADAAAVSDAA